MSRTTRPLNRTSFADAAATAVVAAGAGRRGSSMLRSNVVPAVLGGFVVLVAGTGTAVATTGTFIHLTDATSGVPARVDDEGRLAVGDAEGPLTVDVAGRVPVSGTVNVANRPVVTPAEIPWSGTVTAQKAVGMSWACTGSDTNNGNGVQYLPELPEGYRVRLASVQLTVQSWAATGTGVNAWVQQGVKNPTPQFWSDVVQGVPLSARNVHNDRGGRIETDLVLSETPVNGEASRMSAQGCFEGPTDKAMHMSTVFTGTLVPNATTLHLP